MATQLAVCGGGRGHNACCKGKRCVVPGCETTTENSGQFAHPRNSDEVILWFRATLSKRVIEDQYPNGLNAGALGCCCLCQPCNEARKAYAREANRHSVALTSNVAAAAVAPTSPVGTRTAPPGAMENTAVKIVPAALHCEFCTNERRIAKSGSTPLLPGEGWGDDKLRGQAHAMQISGRCGLG